MAPSFDTLTEQDLHEEEEEEVDFSGECFFDPGGGWIFFVPPLFALTRFCPSPDLKAQYEVKLEESLDTFIVVDGLPIVPDESRQKLIKFLLKKMLTTVGHTSEDAVFMPLNDKNMSEGYVC